MHRLSEAALLFLIAHFVSDYHLQSEEAAKEKSTAAGFLRHLLVHLLVQLPILAWMALRGEAAPGALLVLLVTGSHTLTDLVKYRIPQRIAGTGGAVYLADQAVHAALILLLCEFVFAAPLRAAAAGLPLPLLRWGLLLTLITKPANVTFKILFSKYQLKPAAGGLQPMRESVVTEPGAGALIGNLERILSAIFLSAGQFAAIGLIYTAKSIARFKQIEENRRFAEYYLIGTLYSILYVVALYYLLIVGVL